MVCISPRFGAPRLAPLLLVAVLAMAVWPAPANGSPVAEPTAPMYAPDRAIIGFDTTTDSALQAVLGDLGGALVYTDHALGIAVVQTDDPEAFVTAAQNRDGIRYAERDPLVFPEHEPNDMFYGNQWGPPAIEAPTAWDTALGDGVTVAILDTGVEYLHPDLLLSMWTNLDDIPRNGIDDDGNGYVDDYIGWDFSNNDNDPASTGCGYHGTHVAGIVAATQDNVFGITGVAPHAKIMALRMLCGGSALSDGLRAIRYAAENGARIVSCSWYSSTGSQAFAETVTWAYETYDMAFTKSAGNQNGGHVTYPGTLPEFIAVSSIDSDLGISSFSSQGTKVELAAPGGNIYSTYDPGRFSYLSGTSMAAPHVAGVAALVWSAEPDLPRDVLRARLSATATDAGAPGRDVAYGNGIVDAAAALGL